METESGAAVFPIARGSSSTFWFTAAVVGFTLFEVTRAGLRIRGPYGRLITRDAMDLEEARVVDLKTDPSYRLGIRTGGIGMPGYASGWFRLKGCASALLFVTERTRSVAIPTSLGYTLLLSPADPDAFIKSLKGW